ncbi:hypothetical protein MalM25_06350 [Planctomycetes bacterium MalM25]|nr:hypothetical protein MalM25_06350 [Planctomycetes bacterium MalM25]
MTLLTSLGWYTSSYRALLGIDYPNSVHACCKSGSLGIGFVSIGGVSSLFLERDPRDKYRRVWGERPDGGFCDFYLPTGGVTGWEVYGFAMRIDPIAVAWSCPYFLMVFFWACVAGSKLRRFGVAEALGVMTCIAVYLTLAFSRTVLPLLVLVNLLTLLAMLVALANKVIPGDASLWLQEAS